MTIKSVIPSGQHKGIATHQPPLTVRQSYTIENCLEDTKYIKYKNELKT